MASLTQITTAPALTFDALVDDLDGVRRALGLGRVAVLGHSAHSFLALAYAARYPEQTSHVLAIAGAPGMTAGVFARTTTYWDLVASPERSVSQSAPEATGGSGDQPGSGLGHDSQSCQREESRHRSDHDSDRRTGRLSKSELASQLTKL